MYDDELYEELDDEETEELDSENDKNNKKGKKAEKNKENQKGKAPNKSKAPNTPKAPGGVKPGGGVAAKLEAANIVKDFFAGKISLKEALAKAKKEIVQALLKMIPYVGMVLSAIYGFAGLAGLLFVVVLAIILSITPPAGIIVIIYAIIQGLLAFLSACLHFLADVGYKILDNATFGIFDFETVQDVNDYMGMLDKSNDDMVGESGDSGSQTRDLMLDMYDMSKNYFDELYVVGSAKCDGIELPTNLQEVKSSGKDPNITFENKGEEDVVGWLDLSTKQKYEYSATSIYGISEEILEDFYYGNLYEKYGALNDGEKVSIYKYCTYENYIAGDQSYVKREGDIYKYEIDNDGHDEKEFKNGYAYDHDYKEDKIPDYSSKKEYIFAYIIDGELYIPATKLSENKVYYDQLGKEIYTHKGSNIGRSGEDGDVISYYDILKNKSIDAISFIYLSSYKDVPNFNKDDVAFNSLTIRKRQDEVKKLLKNRLDAYVSAENAFWNNNGDQDTSASDVIAAIIIPTGLVDIIDKTLLDNDGIKKDGYRMLETKKYEATIGYKSEDGGNTWKFEPSASKTLRYVYKATGSITDFFTNLIGDALTSDEDYENVIFAGDLFSFSISLEDGVELDLEGDTKIYTAVKVADNHYELYDNGEVVETYKGYTKKGTETENISGTDVEISFDQTVTYYSNNGRLYWKDYTKILNYDSLPESAKAQYSSPMLFFDNGIRNISLGVSYDDPDTEENDKYPVYVVESNSEPTNPSSTALSGDMDTQLTLLMEGKLFDGNYKPPELKGISLYYGYMVKLKELKKKEAHQMSDNQKKVYELYKDGGNISEVQDEVGSVVDLKNINSVNEYMEDTGYEFLDERELAKSYGIPSAFAYFVPLEESTRNIPFLTALASEMRNTRIFLSKAERPHKLKDEEVFLERQNWVYDITQKHVSAIDDIEGNFGIAKDDLGRIYVKAFGTMIITHNSLDIKNYKINVTKVPFRGVVVAQLWDRIVFNHWKEVSETTGDILIGPEYTKQTDYIIANQFVEYNDKPYDLITKYNVSQVDLGIYQEVTGRPFLNQYVYEKIQNIQEGKKDYWAKNEFADALMSKTVLEPLHTVTSCKEVTTEHDEGIKSVNGYEYRGSGPVRAILDGIVVDIQQHDISGKYNTYVILFHEENSTFSMYSNLTSINPDLKKPTRNGRGEYEYYKVSQGDKVGEVGEKMYFEYRQGGGEVKEFWSATPIKIRETITMEDVIKQKNEAAGNHLPG